MKVVLATTACAVVLTLLFIQKATRSAGIASQILNEKKHTAIACTPDWNVSPVTARDIQQMMPLPGTGNHKWKISTGNDSAQFYFNQGINLYYGFHIIEAIPSFKKAETFDQRCA